MERREIVGLTLVALGIMIGLTGTLRWWLYYPEMSSPMAFKADWHEYVTCLLLAFTGMFVARRRRR